MIDKIKCSNKIGCDIHKELIDLLNYSKHDCLNDISFISEEEYNLVRNNKEKYPSWYVGLVGFCASFGAKYFGGYARSKSDKYNGEKSEKAINNLKKQSANLKDISFINIDFMDININTLNNYVIYCDIPYRDTIKYKTDQFPYEEFYVWVKMLSKNNTVLISEYNMPEEFQCMWQKEVTVVLDNIKEKDSLNKTRIEKLFTYKGE